MSEIRRLLPRQFTDWRGRYLLEGDSEDNWRDCRVIDVSSAGAGLELLGATPEEAQGQRIVLAVHLRGDIRNSRAGRNGGVRAGIQFVDLTAAERTYLDSLVQLQAAW